MKQFIVAAIAIACFGFLAAAPAQENDYFKTQRQLMECIPPKFLLVSEVDLDAETLTGMSTITRNDPQPVVSAFHLKFNLSDIKVTNARRIALEDADIAKTKGKLVVLHDGKEPLSAAYLGLFQEETIIITIVPEKK